MQNPTACGAYEIVTSSAMTLTVGAQRDCNKMLYAVIHPSASRPLKEESNCFESNLNLICAILMC